MTQTGSMGLISAAPFARGTPGRNSKIMGDLALLDKGGYRPPMPQQARADEPDDQDHATQLLRHSHTEVREVVGCSEWYSAQHVERTGRHCHIRSHN
jgi:hypothetical protein